MVSIRSKEDLKKLDNGNKIIGTYPEMNGTQIIFNGVNNILHCEENVKLENTIINFGGNNGLVYLGKNRNVYMLGVNLYNDSVFYMGRNSYINGKITVVLSEQKHCFIGDDCLFARGIWIRNADPHLIYDCRSLERINKSKSIFLGDHVWVGQSAVILKGTKIDSGSIIGANGVVAGKTISCNSSWGGNPCRLIRNNIFWDGQCVHSWTQKQTDQNMNYRDCVRSTDDPSQWIYEYEKDSCIMYEDIDKKLSENITSMEKVEYLKNIHRNKNRFVHLY